MLKEFIQRQGTAEYPLLGPIIWFRNHFGLRFPKATLGKVLCVVVHESVMLHVLTQYIQLYFSRDDVDYMIKNLNTALLSVTCAAKANTMLYWQHSWQDAFTYATEVDKFERLTQNPARGKIITRYTSQCFKLTYFYCIFCFGTNVMVIAPNLVKYLTSPTFREMLRNGTEPFPHIYYTWAPYDMEQFPLNWITVVWHVYVSWVGTAQILVFDLSTVVFMLFFSAEFEMLRLRSSDLMEGLELIDEEEFNARVRLLHTLHTHLVKNIRLVRSLLSPVMFLYMLLCSLLLCTTGMQLTSDYTSTSQKLMLAEYTLFVLTQVFLYCWMSHDVFEKSSDLFRGPYESAWCGASRQRRRAVLLLAGQMRASYVFSAGPFTDLTLPTFVAILKGAYSYYTLLRK